MRKTNIEKLTDMMQFSRVGPLSQLFVIDAITKFAAQVANTPLEQLRAEFGEDHLIAPEAWQAAAREVLDTFNSHQPVDEPHTLGFPDPVAGQPTSLTDDEFIEKYRPLLDSDNALVEISDSELTHYDANNRLWTMMDVDGALILSSGLHHVNRMFYVATALAYEDGEHIEVVWYQDKEPELVDPQDAMPQGEYVMHGGLQCPRCGSENISPGQVYHSDNDPRLVLCPVECHSCEAEWSEQYTLQGYTDLRRPEED